MTHLRPILESLEGKLLLSHVHPSHLHALSHSVQVITLAPPPVFAPVTAPPAVSVLSACDAHPPVWQYPITPTIYLEGRNPLIPNPVTGTQACMVGLGGCTVMLNITVPAAPYLPQM